MSSIATLRDVGSAIYYDHKYRELYITKRALRSFRNLENTVYIPFTLSNYDMRNYTGLYIPMNKLEDRLPLIIRNNHVWRGDPNYSVSSVDTEA